MYEETDKQYNEILKHDIIIMIGIGDFNAKIEQEHQYINQQQDRTANTRKALKMRIS